MSCRSVVAGICMACAAVATPTVLPSRGAQGGVGGSYTPSGLEAGLGISLAVAAAAAGGTWCAGAGPVARPAAGHSR